MIHLIIFVFYLLFLFGFGSLVLNYSSLLKSPRLSKLNTWITFSLCLGLCTNLLFSHLLAFILQSFSMSCRIISLILILIGAYWWIFFSKKFFQKINFTVGDIYVTLLATCIAIICAIRGHTTDSDNSHIPWSACISLNNIYPPRLPIDPITDMSFYHYGTDLYVSTLNIVTGAAPWDAISMQVFIGVLLVFLGIHALFSSFTDSRKINIFSTLIVFFYTSETSIFFFLKHINEIKINNLINFIKQWQEVSLVSAADIPYYSSLISQNMSLSPLLLIFIMLFFSRHDDTKISKIIYYSCITVFSYSAYSSYPSWWFTSLAGILLFQLLNCLRSGNWMSIFFGLMSFSLAKFFAFDGNAGELNGVKALILRPRLFWEHYAMPFMGYFDFSKENSIKVLPDFVSGKIVLDIPLYHWLSFVNWGSLLLISCFCILVFSKKIFSNNSLLFFITSIPGIVFPFLFDYILRPSEVCQSPRISNNLITCF